MARYKMAAAAVVGRGRRQDHEMAAAAGVGVSHGGGWVGPAAAVPIFGQEEGGWPSVGDSHLEPAAGSGEPLARN